LPLLARHRRHPHSRFARSDGKSSRLLRGRGWIRRGLWRCDLGFAHHEGLVTAHLDRSSRLGIVGGRAVHATSTRGGSAPPPVAQLLGKLGQRLVIARSLGSVSVNLLFVFTHLTHTDSLLLWETPVLLSLMSKTKRTKIPAGSGQDRGIRCALLAVRLDRSCAARARF